MFRLLGLLGGLSVVTDLGSGAPMEEALRRSVVAARLARVVGSADDVVADVIYTSLLQHLGCTAYSHEAARLFGDDIAVTRLAFLTSTDRPADIFRIWAPGMARATGQSRTRAVATLLVAGRRLGAQGPVATCEVAREAARRLGLPPGVQTSLFQGLAQWNGKGYPGLAGAEIALTTRIMHVASTGVLFAADAQTAVAAVRRRSGSHLDPELAEAFCDRASELLDGLTDLDAYQQVLELEPDPVRVVAPEALPSVAGTFGDLVDLKSPWLMGHSSSVGELAAAAAGIAGLGADAQVARIAGLLHDLGRVAVSSRIWAKPGPLSASEWDQVRLHPYHTERVLVRVRELASAATVAGQHHERMDGSGYHRGSPATQLPMASRVLAAADAYRCAVEDRPYRPQRSATEAAKVLREQVREGRLDGDAVAAVLTAAGHHLGSRRPRPADLTARQVEVLRLIAAGGSNRDIADRLVISQRTAEHHVQDVYQRIGVSSRAGAALFAMEHGLLASLEETKPG